MMLLRPRAPLTRRVQHLVINGPVSMRSLNSSALLTRSMGRIRPPQSPSLVLSSTPSPHRIVAFRFSSEPEKPPTPSSSQRQRSLESLKSVMDVNLGDQLSVILIVVLTTAILLGPSLMKNLQQATDYDDFFSADDPIDDLTKLARQEWGLEAEAGEETKKAGDLGEKRNALEYVLGDVLKSSALQSAAQQFVVETLQSEPVKAALQGLLKELWTDLVTDKETLAQILKVLQFAIANPEVKAAARQLVLELVDDEEVKTALIVMIQQLVVDNQVRVATQTLITESAHHTLNDPDILDHSMEFATDVVGDDIVQRTAGEALRNTVSHAVRPATSVLLTTAGVGLVLFGLVSIGYARSSEQEAILFERAARSMHANTADGLARLIQWPGQIFGRVVQQASVLIVWPVQIAQRFVTGVAQTSVHVVIGGWHNLAALSASAAHKLVESMTLTGQNMQAGMAHRLVEWGQYLMDSLSSILSAAAAALSTVVAAGVGKTKSMSQRASSSVWSSLVASLCALQASLKQWVAAADDWLEAAVPAAVDRLGHVLVEFRVALEALWREAVRPKV